MRNSDIVRAFKKRLVRAFFEMAARLQQAQPPAGLSRLEILQLALDSEQKRLEA